MAKMYNNEGYYNKLVDLQEKLRKSEEERLKLEEKFNYMIRSKRDEEQLELRRLKTKCNEFLEDDKHRNERNDKLLYTLERIEYRAAMLTAKTDRLRLLRQQYETYLMRSYTSRRSAIDSEISSRHPPSYRPSPDPINPFAYTALQPQQWDPLHATVSFSDPVEAQQPARVAASLRTAAQFPASDRSPYTPNARQSPRSYLPKHDSDRHLFGDVNGDQKQSQLHLTENFSNGQIRSGTVTNALQENTGTVRNGRGIPGLDNECEDILNKNSHRTEKDDQLPMRFSEFEHTVSGSPTKIVRVGVSENAILNSEKTSESDVHLSNVLNVQENSERVIEETPLLDKKILPNEAMSQLECTPKIIKQRSNTPDNIQNSINEVINSPMLDTNKTRENFEEKTDKFPPINDDDNFDEKQDQEKSGEMENEYCIDADNKVTERNNLDADEESDLKIHTNSAQNSDLLHSVAFTPNEQSYRDYDNCKIKDDNEKDFDVATINIKTGIPECDTEEVVPVNMNTSDTGVDNEEYNYYGQDDPLDQAGDAPVYGEAEYYQGVDPSESKEDPSTFGEAPVFCAQSTDEIVADTNEGLEYNDAGDASQYPVDTEDDPNAYTNKEGEEVPVPSSTSVEGTEFGTYEEPEYNYQGITAEEDQSGLPYDENAAPIPYTTEGVQLQGYEDPEYDYTGDQSMVQIEQDQSTLPYQENVEAPDAYTAPIDATDYNYTNYNEPVDGGQYDASEYIEETPVNQGENYDGSADYQGSELEPTYGENLNMPNETSDEYNTTAVDYSANQDVIHGAEEQPMQADTDFKPEVEEVMLEKQLPNLAAMLDSDTESKHLSEQLDPSMKDESDFDFSSEANA